MKEIIFPKFIVDYINISISNEKLSGSKLKKYKTKEIESWLISNGLKAKQVYYLIKNKLSYIPVCEICGKKLKNFENGTRFCSNKCIFSSDEIKNKIKQTNMQKYGCECYSKTEECKEKTKMINRERYGCDYGFQNKEIKEKIKQTNIERYGTEFPIQNKEIKEKIKQTNREKYGYDYAIQNENVKGKVKQTNRERYCVDYLFQDELFKEKIKKTNREKYGYDYAIQNENVKEKQRKTCLERFNHENPNTNEDVKRKKKETFIERYGVENPSQIPDIREKIEMSWKEIYGTTHPNKSKLVKEKGLHTHRENYYQKFLDLINKKQLKLMMTKEEYINEKILKFKCTKCGIEFETEKSNPQKIYCKSCFQQVSNKEKELLSFIKSIYNGTVIENDRSIISNKELDIYIPEKNLAIEFNGNYWHSTSNIKDRYYHQKKTIKCLEKNIRLIHVYEYEWDNYRNKIQSLIFDAFGYSKEVDDFIIKEISSQEYISFLEVNSMYNPINSKTRYGLFSNKYGLVSIVGFTGNRLDSYVNKFGFRVKNGLTKVLDDYNISFVTVSLDISHTNLNEFFSNGFHITGIEEPKINDEFFIYNSGRIEMKKELDIYQVPSIYKQNRFCL